MAGTPTPNYQFPTYAETDTPNLAGAYNQAVNAIDAKIKEVADSVSSGGDVPDATSTTKGIAKLYDSATVGAGDQDDGGITPKAVDDKIGGSLTGYAPKFTVATPITYSDNQIGIRHSNPAADGAQNGYGAVQVTGKQSDVAEANSLTTATVPNVKAVKDYVDAKVPTEQLAYTGTAPIKVDNESRAISVKVANDATWNGSTPTLGTVGVVSRVNLPNSTSAVRIDAQDNNYWSTGDPSYCVPTVATLRGYVALHTPDASTSKKGLVQLRTDFNDTDQTMAVTGATIGSALNGLLTSSNRAASNANTPLTTEMLANLYVTPSGMVVYKAPTE